MRKNIVWGFLFLLLASTQAFGLDVTFSDSPIYLNGYPSLDAVTRTNGPDNNRDYIGSPNFTGGTAAVDGGKLIRLAFDYMMDGDTNIKPTDLFIDKGANGTWDYLVRLYDTSGTSGDYSLYSISIPFGSSGSTDYVYSNTAWTATGFNIRDNHPVAMNMNNPQSPVTLVGTVGFDGWKTAPIGTTGNYSSTFNFGNGLDLGNEDFIFFWTVNCANDVVLEKVNVPEPGTMLLLGFGLVSLVGMGRLRKKN